MRETDQPSAVRRAFASTPLGPIHHAESGDGEPVLFLHETPRSWDQFRDVLPIVGTSRRAIAMDTLGFGDSCAPRGDEASIEAYAEGVHLLLDALELDRVDLVGHHTGGVIAIEVAATAPERVRTLVVSSTPLTDEAFARESEGLGVDEAEQSEDGAHLTTLWGKRLAFYPEAGRADLLDRFVVDAIKSGRHAAGGHEACAAYRMEDRIAHLSMPVHMIVGGADEHACQHGPRLAERVSPVSSVVLDGAWVPMPEQMPEAFAAAVLGALER